MESKQADKLNLQPDVNWLVILRRYFEEKIRLKIKYLFSIQDKYPCQISVSNLSTNPVLLLPIKEQNSIER